MTTDLFTTALISGILRCKPGKGHIVHSDNGGQSTSQKFRATLAKYGFEQSMGRVGRCDDHVVAESWVAHFKREAIDDRRPKNLEELEACLKAYVDEFYNQAIYADA